MGDGRGKFPGDVDGTRIERMGTDFFFLISRSEVYILIGIQLEERKLIQEFGAEYLQYKKDVRMLIPFLF